MSRGRRVSFHASPRHIRLVGEWLVNDYAPTSSILRGNIRDEDDRRVAQLIGRFLLDQLSRSRRFKQRPIGMVLGPLALKWLAANLPTWRRVSVLHGPLGSFGQSAGRAVPRKRGRPPISLQVVLDPNLRPDLSDRQIRRDKRRIASYRASF